MIDMYNSKYTLYEYLQKGARIKDLIITRRIKIQLILNKI